jgi:O-antigen biosynthesis protein
MRRAATAETRSLAAPEMVADIELTDPIGTAGDVGLAASRYRSAQLLVRLHGAPLGVVCIPLSGGFAAPHQVAALVWDELADTINDHLRSDGLPPLDGLHAAGTGWSGSVPLCRHPFLPPADPPLVSVLIATSGRPDQIAACVGSVLESDYPRFDVLIVDNAPSDPRTRQVFEHEFASEPRVRYLREPRRGLSRARNLGMRFARGSLVAFTDDDVRVDGGWLSAIAGAFAQDPRIACVTGLVMPAELETKGQIQFERSSGFSKGFVPERFDLQTGRAESPLFPYQLGRYGLGANMALRKGVMGDGWGFDVALGLGTPSQGGEDLDAYLDILWAGHVIAYEPRALVRHYHRRGHEQMREQMRHYGVGLSATLTKRLLTDRGHRLDMVRRVPAGIRHATTPASRISGKQGSYPRDLLLQEWLGILEGPFAYIRSRLRNAWQSS